MKNINNKILKLLLKPIFKKKQKKQKKNFINTWLKEMNKRIKKK